MCKVSRDGHTDGVCAITDVLDRQLERPSGKHVPDTVRGRVMALKDTAARASEHGRRPLKQTRKRGFTNVNRED